MRNRISNILIGLFFVIIGVGICGDILDFWTFNIFFPGWWTLFIIVPCVIWIIRDGFNVVPLIGIGIGAILLLERLDIIKYRNLWRLLFPVIIIAIGFSIIYKSFRRKEYSRTVKTSCDGSSECPDYTAVFGEFKPDYTNTSFTGAKTTVLFGGGTLDLRQAIITEDCVIDSTTIFGGTEIFLPPNVKSKVSAMPIFGGVDDKTIKNTSPDAPTVYINASCIFAGMDLK